MHDQISNFSKALPLKSNGLFPKNTPLITSYRATTMATNILECNDAAKMNLNLNKIFFFSLTWTIIELEMGN